ncbi:MAG TPA: hypothetical protein VHX12_04695, partial [Acidisoma sp.]|nr:hypothetical protein [Acidisoma sp.]
MQPSLMRPSPMRPSPMRDIDCLFDPAAATDSGQRINRLHAVPAEGLAAFLAELPQAPRDFLSFAGFTAKAGAVALLPPVVEGGPMEAVLGLGTDRSHVPFGALPFGLP